MPTFSMQTAQGSTRSDSNNNLTLSVSAICTPRVKDSQRRPLRLYARAAASRLVPPEFPFFSSRRTVTYS